MSASPTTSKPPIRTVPLGPLPRPLPPPRPRPPPLGGIADQQSRVQYHIVGERRSNLDWCEVHHSVPRTGCGQLGVEGCESVMVNFWTLCQGIGPTWASTKMGQVRPRKVLKLRQKRPRRRRAKGRSYLAYHFCGCLPPSLVSSCTPNICLYQARLEYHIPV